MSEPGVGSGKPGPGRPKGLQNKITTDIKAMILAALDAKGGQKYLEEQAGLNPVAFMGLLGKILPTQINADVSGSLSYVLVGQPEAEDAAAWQSQHAPPTGG